jgi:hypothetical protein
MADETDYNELLRKVRALYVMNKESHIETFS